MSQLKDFFQNSELKTGGLYELSIQVCPSTDNTPIKNYTNFIWNKLYVDGPYDKNFKLIPIDIKNIEHQGLLNIANYKLPFMTYNIREVYSENINYNWFDICFYTSAIQHIFGNEYQTWTESSKIPYELEQVLSKLIVELYDIFPFQLAMLGFEISGQYYLNDLKQNLKLPLNQMLITGNNNAKKIDLNNKKNITFVEDLITSTK